MEKQTEKRVPIEKIILGTVAAAGILAAVAIAPGVGPALRVFGVGKRYPNRNINRAIKRAEEKGYITYIRKNGKRYARLTKKGERQLAAYELRNMPAQNAVNTRHRSGEWHVVIFDIAESKRVLRDRIRRQLERAGFKRIQGSVWVSPWNSEEFVRLLKANNKIGKDILYLRTRYFENERELKKRFGL